jgi:hypothetical protein
MVDGVWLSTGGLRRVHGARAYLDEANVGGLLTEALAADVESILADQTGLMGADAAIRFRKKKIVSISVSFRVHIPRPPALFLLVFSF